MAHAYSHGNCIHLDNGNTSMRTGLTPWSIRQQLDARYNNHPQGQQKEKIKVLFFGSDSFSVPHLEALITERDRPGSIIERVDVVSPKERPNRTKNNAEESPVTVLAKKHNLTTFPAPERRTGIEAWKFPKLDGVDGWDFGVVVSFGWFLPNDIISQFKKAGVNVHPSLLPKYRGSAPLQRSIMNQDKTTGVTIQLLDPNEFDAGKILRQEEVTMPHRPTYHSLEGLLAKKGAELLVDVINNYDERRQAAKSQDPKMVTKAPKISREASVVNWNVWSAERAERLHRANGFRYPVASKWLTQPSGKVLPVSLFDLHLVDGADISDLSVYGSVDTHPKDCPPGTLFFHRPSESLHITCADGSLLGVGAVQFEGKKRLTAKDFVNGYKITSGYFLRVHHV
ncbi:hypothetical protein DFQ27_007869 [Actinomortierella ambigua]|uniref:Methionyl-tRNA formyltransferase, mitochondrial n=1 Tax=Actinomortierella ambigua TaxID=1343610 RepID=A0A9P6TZ42_9FUNG|nr:hypothetical protein DFQ27_007869 [Actinomortierella ambigua]